MRPSKPFPLASHQQPGLGALYPNLAQNIYSAEIAGNNNGTGVALAEVYDLNVVRIYTATTPRLTALSTRVRVGTGDNILIVGFVIEARRPKTVLIPRLGAGPGPIRGTQYVARSDADALSQRQHRHRDQQRLGRRPADL